MRAERNIGLFLNARASAVEKKRNPITAVTAENIKTSKELRFSGCFFADCIGDAAIGYLAGADLRYGREGKGETGQAMAPEKADKMVMGASVMWYSRQNEKERPFPDCP